MSTVKEEARQVIEELPDHASWNDVLYELHVRQKIHRGLAAVSEGNVVSHADVREMFKP